MLDLKSCMMIERHFFSFQAYLRIIKCSKIALSHQADSLNDSGVLLDAMVASLTQLYSIFEIISTSTTNARSIQYSLCQAFESLVEFLFADPSYASTIGFLMDHHIGMVHGLILGPQVKSDGSLDLAEVGVRSLSRALKEFISNKYQANVLSRVAVDQLMNCLKLLELGTELPKFLHVECINLLAALQCLTDRGLLNKDYEIMIRELVLKCIIEPFLHQNLQPQNSICDIGKKRQFMRQAQAVVWYLKKCISFCIFMDNDMGHCLTIIDRQWRVFGESTCGTIVFE